MQAANYSLPFKLPRELIKISVFLSLSEEKRRYSRAGQVKMTNTHITISVIYSPSLTKLQFENRGYFGP